MTVALVEIQKVSEVCTHCWVVNLNHKTPSNSSIQSWCYSYTYYRCFENESLTAVPPAKKREREAGLLCPVAFFYTRTIPIRHVISAKMETTVKLYVINMRKMKLYSVQKNSKSEMKLNTTTAVKELSAIPLNWKIFLKHKIKNTYI